MKLFPSDWLRLFAPETPLFELIARGSVLYLGILILMRFMPRRTGGELATMDLIFVVLIAEAATHSLGNFTSITDGMILVLTFMGWNYLVNALSYRVPWFEHLVSAQPIQVVRDGRLLRRNMRREFLTEEELLTHLREREIAELEDVKAAYIEGDGQITFVKRKGA